VSGWERRTKTCPLCRTPTESAKVDHRLANIIEAHLAAHPDKRRPAEDLAALDAADTITKVRAPVDGRAVMSAHLVGREHSNAWSSMGGSGGGTGTATTRAAAMTTTRTRRMRTTMTTATVARMAAVEAWCCRLCCMLAGTEPVGVWVRGPGRLTLLCCADTCNARSVWLATPRGLCAHPALRIFPVARRDAPAASPTAAPRRASANAVRQQMHWGAAARGPPHESGGCTQATYASKCFASFTTATAPTARPL
jgi:hypothetical protein